MQRTSREDTPRARLRSGLAGTLTLGLIVCIGNTASAEPFQGSYESNYGTMTLHRVGTYVIGEYGDQGILAGRIEGSCVSGAYINGSSTGAFRFDLTAEEDIDGQWGAHGTPLAANWDATRTGPAPIQMRNFARDGSVTQRIANTRTDYNGRFSSTFGQIDLHSQDLFLIADYADRGVAIGMWDGNSMSACSATAHAPAGLTGRFYRALPIFAQATGAGLGATRKILGRSHAKAESPSQSKTCPRTAMTVTPLQLPVGQLKRIGRTPPAVRFAPLRLFFRTPTSRQRFATSSRMVSQLWKGISFLVALVWTVH